MILPLSAVSDISDLADDQNLYGQMGHKVIILSLKRVANVEPLVACVCISWGVLGPWYVSKITVLASLDSFRNNNTSPARNYKE